MPCKEKFYSSLTTRKIIDKEYEHALNLWNKFEMKIMKDYHDLYLKCAVLLLAAISDKNYERKCYLDNLCFCHLCPLNNVKKLLAKLASNYVLGTNKQKLDLAILWVCNIEQNLHQAMLWVCNIETSFRQPVLSICNIER